MKLEVRAVAWLYLLDLYSVITLQVLERGTEHANAAEAPKIEAVP